MNVRPILYCARKPERAKKLFEHMGVPMAGDEWAFLAPRFTIRDVITAGILYDTTAREWWGGDIYIEFTSRDHPLTRAEQRILAGMHARGCGVTVTVNPCREHDERRGVQRV